VSFTPREEVCIRIAESCHAGGDHAPGLDSGPNRLAWLEKRCTREWPDRAGLDHRIDGVTRHSRSSCDLFNSEDVRES
jgi:hypothetical protein